LPANIGYLKLRYFAPGREGEALVDAAMLMLKDSDALIIDLRENTGGGGASDERLLGHLSRAPIPMAMIRWRQPDGTWKEEQRRASTPPGGPLFADKPVFVLTAKRTFSAAEGFALDLKASGRALLIGETTRGGANPGHARLLGHGLDVFVPSGMVTHPLTKGNWNGKGVEPDIAVPAGDALTEAYRRALAVAKPTVATPKSVEEREKAIADPRAALIADQPL
jgi:C-terminal processing protease CtpA/Prc